MMLDEGGSYQPVQTAGRKTLTMKLLSMSPVTPGWDND